MTTTSTDNTYKLRAISLLHMIGYNSDAPAGDLGAELLYAIGDVLEGRRVEELDLRVINRKQLITELQHVG